MRLAACALLALLVGGCGGGERPLIAAGKAAVVRGELVPSVHLFGEPILARVDVVLDREKIDPADVRLEASFEPYEKVGVTQQTRRDVGDFTVIRYTTTLRCLDQRCIPRTASGETTVSQVPGLPPFLPGQQRDEKVKYVFPPARVIAEDVPEDKTLGRVVWTPLRSLSRINWDDSSVVGQGFPFVTRVTPLPEPEYRIPPTLLGLGLLGIALALLALPAWLLWERSRRHGVTREVGPPQSALERALRLVEWASRRPAVEERREALEALALELENEDDADSARRAREQGWSPPSPEPAQMTELVASIRESDAPAS